MTPTRHVEINGHDAYVFDNLIPNVVAELHDEYLTCTSYRLTESTSSHQDKKHWVVDWGVEEILGSDIGRLSHSLVHELFPGEEQQPTRCYTNVATYGDALMAHHDCPPDRLDVTVLWFICRDWQPNWRGEWLLLDENGSAELAVTPRCGRMVIFRGALNHVGTPPSRVCFNPRYTLAFKFRPGGSLQPEVIPKRGINSTGDFFAKLRHATFPIFDFEEDRLVKFVITGEDHCTWWINLTHGSVGAGEVDAAMTITITDANFLSVLRGELDPTDALLTQKLKVQGDMSLLPQVVSVINCL